MKIEDLTPDQIERLAYEADIIADLSLVWVPHPAQDEAKVALFYKGVFVLFLENGRKYGKTEILAYCLFRYAMSVPNSACYYIAPLQKQAREIIWANNRLQDFLVPEVLISTGRTAAGHTREEAMQIGRELKEKYIKTIRDQEMRIIFNNGSFIKLDGSDNYEAYRGVTPSIIIYDEFKDFHPKFHIGMGPNLAAKSAPLMIVGTPPDGTESNAENFVALADDCKVDERGFYQNLSSYANPYISRDFLAREKARLYRMGKEDEWLREYMAKRVRSGSKIIFKNFVPPNKDLGETTSDHVMDHDALVKEVFGRYKDWEFYASFDPASTSCFAFLFAAVNKYDSRVRVIDEFYERDKGEMSAKKVMRKCLEIMRGYHVLLEDIDMVYDNAAAWFYNEITQDDEFEDIALTPCEKDVKTKNDKISLIRTAFDFKLMKFSNKCTNLITEVTEYRTDDKNKVIKENDHGIDDLRYILNAAHYDLNEYTPPSEEKNLDGPRYHTMEQELDL